MELHERLSSTRTQTAHEGPDLFAELKNHIHLAVIGELGPQLFNVHMDPVALRERVVAETRTRLAGEVGLSRDDRDRLTGAPRARPNGRCRRSNLEFQLGRPEARIGNLSVPSPRLDRARPRPRG